jgi:hypothetical protein
MVEMITEDFEKVLEALRFFHEMVGDENDVELSLVKLEEALEIMESYS